MVQEREQNWNSSQLWYNNKRWLSRESQTDLAEMQRSMLIRR